MDLANTTKIGHVAQHRRPPDFRDISHTVCHRIGHALITLHVGLVPILAFEYFRPQWDNLIGRTEPHAMSLYAFVDASTMIISTIAK